MLPPDPLSTLLEKKWGPFTTDQRPREETSGLYRRLRRSNCVLRPRYQWFPGRMNGTK